MTRHHPRKQYPDNLSALQCYLEVSDHYEHGQRELLELRKKLEGWARTKNDAQEYLEKVLGKEGSVTHHGRVYFINDHGRLSSREIDVKQTEMTLEQAQNAMVQPLLDILQESGDLEYTTCVNCGHIFYDRPMCPQQEARIPCCNHCT